MVSLVTGGTLDEKSVTEKRARPNGGSFSFAHGSIDCWESSPGWRLELRTPLHCVSPSEMPLRASVRWRRVSFDLRPNCMP